MLEAINCWRRQRRARRNRWREDALYLLAAEDAGAYYEAQRRAARSRLGGDREEFFHWVKVAAEVARLSPTVAMDLAVLRDLVAAEEQRSGQRK